jgi:hypothetical protein
MTLTAPMTSNMAEAKTEKGLVIYFARLKVNATLDTPSAGFSFSAILAPPFSR